MIALRKYVLLQIPGWIGAAVVALGLWHWAGVALWIAGSLFALWVAKDVAFYPLVRIGYPTDTKTGAEQLVGCTAVARERLNPVGYVHVRGELWRAEASPPGSEIPSGAAVVIRAARGLTLVVTAEAPAETGP